MNGDSPLLCAIYMSEGSLFQEHFFHFYDASQPNKFSQNVKPIDRQAVFQKVTFNVIKENILMLQLYAKVDKRM